MPLIATSIAQLSEVQIATFFSNSAPATQKLCDQEAGQLMHMPVHPAFVQDGTSYYIPSCPTMMHHLVPFVPLCPRINIFNKTRFSGWNVESANDENDGVIGEGGILSW